MKHLKLLTLGLAAASALWLAGCHPHDHDHAGHDHADHDHGSHKHGKDADAPKPGAAATAIITQPTLEQLSAAKPYPLETCLVSDEKLGGMGKPVVVLVGDQQVKLCCDDCLPKLKADPAGMLGKLTK
jgi:hypothetical protein